MVRDKMSEDRIITGKGGRNYGRVENSKSQ